ncbi:MAG TPA: 7-cyano-7-deazaguanine synthase [Phycisphaerae bacterium]|nr:7-cyano-7-deazaguanine synthase [Phycisphaerae bacterium]
MSDHLILCGSARLHSNKKCWTSRKPVKLNADPGQGNVHLQIADITDAMVASLPPVVADLIELATYVYCADQATTRGGNAEFDYGKKWRRHFRFEMPVRCPDVWKAPAVNDALILLLSYLSDDDYEFGFSQAKQASSLSEYLEFDQNTPSVADVQEVVLFSGGIDSLGGAVEEILVANKKVALVSHRPVSKIDNRQRNLVDLIQDRLPDKSVSPFHVPVWVNKDKKLGKAYTQRTRSFLYASLASAVASLFNLDRIRFYENGVVSLNLPICAAVLGGRATRTTHPRVIAGMGELFSLLFGRKFVVENPYIWKTKSEVFDGIKKAGHVDLCKYAVSCTHTWEMTKLHTHCGKCSQCVDRRLAALAAGLSDEEDPEEMYELNVMTDARTDPESQTIIERMVGVANDIEGMIDATQFAQRFGEMSRALRHIEGRTDDVAQRIFQLYQRHAQQVCGAIDATGTALVPEMRRGSIPGTCLISIALGRSPKFQDLLNPEVDNVAEPKLDDLVTLAQVAPFTGLSKRTLERYLTAGKLPPPDFRGGGGTSNKWYWGTITPALANFSKRILPPRFPASRII